MAMNAAAAGGVGSDGIEGVTQCCRRCQRSPKSRLKSLSAVFAKKQQSTTFGETVARQDLLRRQRRRYQGPRAMSSAVSTEPQIALQIAIGGIGEETAVRNNRGDSCKTRSAQASAAVIAISSAMSLAVSTEPEITLKIAIGGIGKETAVHNNRGDSCKTRSAQASAAAVLGGPVVKM